MPQGKEQQRKACCPLLQLGWFQKKIELPCYYNNSRRARVTHELFAKFLSYPDTKAGCRNRNLLLFVDHFAASHSTARGHIRLEEWLNGHLISEQN